MTLDEAAGYAQLGMWQDAWDAIEELPTEQRATPGVMRLRLRCCPELEGWGIGAHIADLLKEGGSIDREAAAHFYIALAVHEARRNEIGFAKDAVRKAVSYWPDVRLAILEDPFLSPTLF